MGDEVNRRANSVIEYMSANLNDQRFISGSSGYHQKCIIM